MRHRDSKHNGWGHRTGFSVLISGGPPASAERVRRGTLRGERRVASGWLRSDASPAPQPRRATSRTSDIEMLGGFSPAASGPALAGREAGRRRSVAGLTPEPAGGRTTSSRSHQELIRAAQVHSLAAQSSRCIDHDASVVNGGNVLAK